MTKKFIKKKESKNNPNADGPKYRTPDHFKGKSAAKASKFSGKGKPTNVKFNPGKFKVQHRG